MDTNELQHHGIIGMKWGVRRYQNADGSLTPAGKRRTSTDRAKARAKQIKADAKEEAKKLKIKAKNKAIVDKAKADANAMINKAKGGTPSTTSKESSKPKSLSEMTNEEIRDAITRKELENRLRALSPEKKSLKQQVWEETAFPAFKEAGKELASKWIKKKGAELLGLNEKEVDELSKLKKEAEKAGLKKQIASSEMIQRQNEEAKKKAKDAADQAEKDVKEAEKEAKKEAKEATKEAKQNDPNRFSSQFARETNRIFFGGKDDDSGSSSSDSASSKPTATKGAPNKTYKVKPKIDVSTTKASDPAAEPYKSAGKDYIDDWLSDWED